MNMQNNRSRDLLNKVYDHLDTIDVTKLSMDEIKDFLEVVQKGQFLETYGQMPLYGYGLANANMFNTNPSVSNATE